jgi:hypothetical protein
MGTKSWFGKHNLMRLLRVQPDVMWILEKNTLRVAELHVSNFDWNALRFHANFPVSRFMSGHLQAPATLTTLDRQEPSRW